MACFQVNDFILRQRPFLIIWVHLDHRLVRRQVSERANLGHGDCLLVPRVINAFDFDAVRFWGIVLMVPVMLAVVDEFLDLLEFLHNLLNLFFDLSLVRGVFWM